MLKRCQLEDFVEGRRDAGIRLDASFLPVGGVGGDGCRSTCTTLLMGERGVGVDVLLDGSGSGQRRRQGRH